MDATTLLLFGFALPLGVMAFCFLEVRALRSWEGGWRNAAYLPLGVFAFPVLRILFDVLRDPTSHDFWPFELLFWTPLALLFLGVLYLMRRISLRSELRR